MSVRNRERRAAGVQRAHYHDNAHRIASCYTETKDGVTMTFVDLRRRALTLGAMKSDRLRGAEENRKAKEARYPVAPTYKNNPYERKSSGEGRRGNLGFTGLDIIDEIIQAQMYLKIGQTLKRR